MNYFICGFSGAGKSYLLKSIEQSYELKNYHFIDLDFLIDQKFATEFDSLGAMIEKIGFETFRTMEFKEIKALHKQRNVFMALGGGTLNEQTELLLKDWTGLWLDTSFDDCFDRIKDDENRPLVKLGEKRLGELYSERLQYYKKHQRVSNLTQVLEITKS